MNTKVLACETLRDELEMAIEKTESTFEVHWVISGLHSFPDRLRATLQHQLDNMEDCGRVLMAFGGCNNSTVGVNTGNKELIFPKVDDCISMLIGSAKERIKLGGESTHFVTPGWLRGEFNAREIYTYVTEKYGEKTGNLMAKRMLHQYKHIGLLDDGSYHLESFLPTFHKLSSDLKLEEQICPASIQYLCNLLTGPWAPDRFNVFPPRFTIQNFPV